MRKKVRILKVMFLIILLASCSIFQINLDEKYQPLAQPVITANGLLLVKYPNGLLKDVFSDEYKLLLKENYKSLYEILLPYNIIITKTEKYFQVRVFDKDRLILTDWSCTESRIDCWNYNDGCNPDTLLFPCKK